ncbi:MAG: NAD-dependent epimerase/dehydratase family protein [Vicinamibacteraceae bacterium]
MRALVTGATGAIGPATVRTLLTSGAVVRAFGRLDRFRDQPDRRPDWPAEVELADGDVTRPETVAAAMPGVDVVIHLAALLHVVNPPPGHDRLYRSINVDGTRAVAEAAAAAGVRRLVLASTTAVYGPTGEQPASEDTAPAPDSWYAESKLEAERAARAVGRQTGLDIVILRLSAVYGPRVRGNYRRLLGAMARGRFVSIGPGHNRRSLVADEDAARAFELAARHPAAAGQTFNVADGPAHTVEEILAAMSAAVGRPQPRWHLPKGLARVVAAAGDIAGSAVGRRPGLRPSVEKYLEESAVDASRICDVLGFQPELDLTAGWRMTAERLRASGELPPLDGAALVRT